VSGSLPAEVAEVLAGMRRYAVICADNRDVLPLLPDKSVAHVITDPPYEAAAHTKQRRVKDGVRTSTWGGADKRSTTSRPLVRADLGVRPGIGGSTNRTHNESLGDRVLPSRGRRDVA
jgi:hypothetical protein